MNALIRSGIAAAVVTVGVVLVGTLRAQPNSTPAPQPAPLEQQYQQQPQVMICGNCGAQIMPAQPVYVARAVPGSAPAHRGEPIREDRREHRHNADCQEFGCQAAAPAYYGPQYVPGAGFVMARMVSPFPASDDFGWPGQQLVRTYPRPVPAWEEGYGRLQYPHGHRR